MNENPKTFSFFMPMQPPTTTHQEKAVRVVKGKPQFYEPADLLDARSKLMAHLAQHRPATPLTGAIGLETGWMFSTDRIGLDGKYRITKPDTDNLQKLLKDCMTELGFWKDDAQVADERCVKTWSATRPGIYIGIRQLE